MSSAVCRFCISIITILCTKHQIQIVYSPAAHNIIVVVVERQHPPPAPCCVRTTMFVLFRFSQMKKILFFLVDYRNFLEMGKRVELFFICRIRSVQK